jgi:hypothetical protein
MKSTLTFILARIKTIIICLLFLLAGIIVGIIIQSKAPISIDGKIRYSEILNWLTTMVIGIIIGYYFKNQYENNKIIKNYLLEDLKNISAQLINLKSYCHELRSLTEFTEEQRKEIISRTNILDKKIKVFLDLLKDCNSSKHTTVNESLINSFNSLNKVLTNDGLYDNPIQPSYFDGITSEGSKFESEIRKLTLDIIKTI